MNESWTLRNRMTKGLCDGIGYCTREAGHTGLCEVGTQEERGTCQWRVRCYLVAGHYPATKHEVSHEQQGYWAGDDD